ncbi:ABC-2 family transporter protein [Botrimarina colliarenosi]|uniref:ABC-2 family transporter protein n=1 Tax=Botrimarina colliarenosi TaxID=2528001 RepID=A0A5C6A9P0_9BACT|nr:ABC transporter permease subunit [Botrimarina colliarenosi]TWT95915.1 ABC-2 family transporter protein [Botrimarina colliarenosi]
MLKLWLTPLWLLALGVTLGLAILALLFGLLWVLNRKAAEGVWAAVSESVLMPILWLGVGMVALFAFAYPQMPTDQVIESLWRLPSMGTQTVTQTIEPRSEDVEVPFAMIAEEVVAYRIESDQDLRVAAAPELAYSRPAAVVQGGEPYEWNTKSKLPRGLTGEVDAVYLTNDGDAPANVTLSFTSEARTPEVKQIPITALSVVGIVLAYLAVRLVAPRASTISAATAKEAISQPLFLLFAIGGAIALVCYIYIPYNTFGEDVKMLKDSGLSTIMVLSILFAVWTASVSVADEIEGKTALTLLSKPISRRDFILGKYLGILWSALLLFVILGVILMGCVSYKVVYDARETSNPTPDWQLCNAEMVSTAPGLVLAFLETGMLAAISVAISTRLPMLPNLLICGAVYVLGHLTPLIVQSGVGQNEFVKFFGRLLSVVLPMLDHLNIQAAIAGGNAVPFAYLGWVTLYALVYITVAMLVALLLFEDRDLA